VVDDGDGEVVAVDERDVVEGLVFDAAALEGELGDGARGLALRMTLALGLFTLRARGL
jgi:hypothetical protein